MSRPLICKNEIQALIDKNFKNPFRDLEKWKIAVFLHVLTTWFTFLVGAQSNAFKASNLEAVGAGGAGSNMALPKFRQIS